MRLRTHNARLLVQRHLPGLFVAGLLLCTVLVAALAPFQKADAATAGTINFQARLENGAGAIAPDGDYNVEFKLYDASSSSGSTQGTCSGDAHCKWVETRISTDKVHVANGYLTVNLGSVTAFGSSINWDQDLWMTMNIGGTGSPSWDGEMSPRLKLTAVPYAFRAGQLASLAGSHTGVLQFAGTFGQDSTITLPDPGAGTATVCYENSTSCGFALSSGNFIQNGTTVQTNANFNIRSAATGSVTAVIQGANGQTADLLDLQSWNGTSTTTLVSVSSAGDVTTQNLTVATGKTLTVTNGLSTLHGGLTADSGTVALNVSSNNNTNINTGGSTGSVSIGNGSAGALTFQSGSTVAFTTTNFNLSTAGVVTLAGGQTIDVTTPGAATANGITVKPGTSTGASANGAAVTINGGDGSGTTSVTGGALNLTGGSATGASGTRNGGSVNIDAGTGATANGAVNLATVNSSDVNIANISGGNTQTVNIGTGNTTAAGGKTINIGTGTPSGSGTNLVTIGTSATAGSLVTLQGNIVLSNPATANTATYLCRNSSNEIAACNTTGTGAAFVQGGNSFGATAVLGTNDANDLAIERNGATKLTVGANNVTFASGIDLLLQGANAYISNPQGTTNSEIFGTGSNTTADRNVLVGNGIAGGAGSDSVLIGYNANPNGSGHEVIIGSLASCSSDACVAIGADSVQAGFAATAVGDGAKATTNASVALGAGASTAGGAQSIALGNDATTTAANQLVIGSSAEPISQAIIGNGVTNASPAGFTLQGTSGNGTDIAGASVTFAGGQGTGTGNGGNLNFQIAKPAGSTGSSLNSLSTVFSLSGSNGSALFKNAADSSTAFRVQNAAGSTTALTVDTTGSTGVTTGGTLTATGLLTANGGTVLNKTLTADSGTTQNVATLNFTSPADTTGSNISQGLNITPTIGNATGGTNTANIINLGAVTGDAQVTLNAINVGALTGTAATETAINIGAGWDSVLSVGGTQIISGAGKLQNAGIDSSVNYSNLTQVGTLTSGALGAGFTTVAVGQGGTGATSFTQYGVLYGNNTSALGVTAAGNTGQCLVGNTGNAPSWGSCVSSISLQSAYAGGNTISTTGSPIGFTLNGSDNFTVATAGGGTGSTTFSLTNGSNATPPAQLVLVTNNDIDQPLAAAIKVTSAAGGITNAIDLSGSNITNAINLGSNKILGTSAVIDFSAFDVSSTGAVTAVGVDAGSGLLQGTGGLTVTGTTSINNNSNNNVSINTGTSTGTVAIGNGAAGAISVQSGSTLALTGTNFSVSTGGVLNVVGGSAGFQIGGAAATGNYLRGNGTSFVSSAIQSGDIPACTGSCNYISNQTTQQSGANFNISGTGVAATALQAPLFQTADGTGASTAVTFRSGNSTTSGNTGGVTIASGNATSGNSGSISIDAGTASGTAGTITLGGTNASDVILGRSGLTTHNNGALTVAQLLTASGGITVAANQNVTMTTGTGVFTQGFTSSTNNANAQALSFTNNNTGAGVTVQGMNITPTNTSTATSGTNTLNGINFAAGGALGGTDLTNGINFASATGYTNFIKTPTAVLSSAGALTGLTGLTSSGTITFSGLTTDGPLFVSGGGGQVSSEANLSVTRGGTGFGSTTAYGLIAGGTTSTGALQNVGTGSSGNILKSNGNAALPTWVSNTQTNVCSDCATTALNNLASVAINAALGFQASSAANINFNGAATAAGNSLTIAGQTAGSTANNGGDVTVRGGTGTTTGSGGTLTLQGGVAASNGTNGTVTIDAGSGATTPNGTVNLGIANASQINIGTGNVTNSINIGDATLSSGSQSINIGTGNTAGGTTNVTIGSGSSAAGGNTTVRANGALTLTAGGTSTWSVGGTNQNLSVQTSGTGTLTLNTTGAGEVDLGNTNSTTIKIGGTSGATTTIAGGDLAHTVAIAAGGSTTVQGVTIGSTSSTSTVAVQGGNTSTGTGAISLQAASGGLITIGTTNSNPITLGGLTSVLTLGTADTSTALCRNSSNQIATCTGGGSSPTLQNAYNNSAGASPSILTTSTNKAVTIQTANSSGIAANSELFGIHANHASDTLGDSLFSVNSSGVGINMGTASLTAAFGNDLTFGQIAGATTARTIGVFAQGTTNIGGNGLTIQAGAGNGTGAGGLTTIQGGAAGASSGAAGGGVTITGAAGTATSTGGAGGSVTISGGNATSSGNNNGGSVLLQGGSATGTGTIGNVVVRNVSNTTGAFQVQNTALANVLNVDTTDSNLILNPGGEVAFGTEWAGYQTGGSVSRTTTAGQFYNGVAAVSVTTGTTNTAGGKNNIGVALTNGTQYVLSFYAKLSSGTMTDLQVGISKDGTTGTEQQCGSNITLSTSAWTRVSCTVTPNASGSTSAYVFFRQANTGTSRTFFVDNVGLTASTNTTTSSIKVGGSGPTTVFTLEQAAAAPIATGQAAYLGSMFYNTTTGHVQCYEAGNGSSGAWGDCGSTTLQQAYNNSAGASPSILTTSTNKAVTIQTSNSSGIAAGSELFGVHLNNSGDTLGNSIFSVNSTTVGINMGSNALTSAFSYDLTFGSGSTRTIGVQAPTTNVAGNGLTIQGGAGGTGASADAGGDLKLQGGAGGGTNGNGGNAYLFGGALNGTGTNGNVILAHNGTTAIGNVGIGTASPTRPLDLAVNNSTVTAMPFLIEQAGSGDPGIELKTATKNFFAGIDNTDGQFKISSAAAADGTFTTGDTAGPPTDAGTDSNGNSTMAMQITAGATGNVSSASVYLTAVAASPNNHVQVSIYANNTGPCSGSVTTTPCPGTLLGSSSTQVAVVGWNTISISGVTLTSGTTYWVAFSGDGASTFAEQVGAANTVSYDTTAAYPAPSSWNQDFHATNIRLAAYVTAVTTGTVDNFSGTPLFRMNDTGAAVFQNSIDSLGSFKLQNAAGTTDVLRSDTTNSRLGVDVAAGEALSFDLSLGGSANRTIGVDPPTATGSGGNLTVTAGAGTTTGTGGLLTLQGGAAAGASQAGGGVTVSGGAAGASGNASGGAININGGASRGNVTGGGITLLAGTGGATGAGGAISITGGTAGGNTVAGGAVTITGGSASGSGAAGAVTLQGGAPTATAGSTSGAVTVKTQNGSSTGTGGAAASVLIQAGSAGGSGNNNGGNVVAQLGASTGTGIQGSFQVQNALGASLLTLDPSNTAASLNLAQNSGGETGGTPPTGWSAHNGTASPTITQDTTSGEFASGTAGIKVAIGSAGTGGVRNALNATALADSTTYIVSFSIKVSSSLSNANLTVEYYRNNTPTLDATCSSFTQATISTSAFIKYTCSFTTTSSANAKATTNFLAIRQTDSVNRNIFIDNLSIVAQNSSGTQNIADLRVGGITGQSLTLFTLDTFASTPFSGSNAQLAGSMYFDTTQNKIQCYDGSTWGACGAAPNSIITLTPEYAGAVLNGPGTGTMTSDFCGNGGGLSVNTGLCASGVARNFYKWTSPQPTSQPYSLYVTYKLPSTFKSFVNGTTTMTGQVDNTTNADVTYAIFRSTGSALSSCSASKSVINGGSANTWITTAPTTDPSTCTFSAGDYVIFQITVSSKSSAFAYAENLNFTFSNQ